MLKKLMMAAVAVLALTLAYIAGSLHSTSQAAPVAKPKIISAYQSQALGDVVVDDAGNLYIYHWATSKDFRGYWFKSMNVFESEANRPTDGDIPK